MDRSSRFVPLKSRKQTPSVGQSVFVAPNASVVGDVKVGGGSAVWYGAVVRGTLVIIVVKRIYQLTWSAGDVNSIRIGNHSHVMDQAVIHVSSGKNMKGAAQPTVLGNNVIVGTSFSVFG